ncbi:alanine/glycine:cation symporter family protein [Mangrovibacterium diazotrophicum]|uniref:AGCS family alanine or glycine:cation symporter n=1 Tax=Mangrovibacterium diazotrophicum TaxID=1261403 RepID=A0A419VWS9_9BACT|nr:alanine/glycine:cation symporter family protein [Mangrovibacterium diazotrophicum]RKD86452.1 AGCS family alanine or glycine:cation symporter [Mangrovibacterium diazotrophicum]
MLEKFGELIVTSSDFMWGIPVLVLLLGGGFYFLVITRLAPIKYIGHAIQIIRGKYDDPNEAGQLKHYQALSTALAGTVGMGNISGVAVAITMGGPGAIFWMWISALLGVSTKFFTCSLAVMYRGKDSAGEIQGGPMYVITEGLGRRWKPLAIFFSVMAMLGVLPIFQSNQLTQVIRDVFLVPNGIHRSVMTDMIIGSVMAIIVAIVVLGGVKRLGNVTGRMVPVMVVVYIVAVLYIIFSHPSEIIPSFRLIFEDAFTGKAVVGGSLGAIIITGVRRAAFSNEAGMGTAPMAHGAAKTNEPIREGLVAMLGPIIDTIIVCTMTALAIIITGVWTHSSSDGITLTAEAFNDAIPYGSYVLLVCVIFFSLSTMFAFPYYGSKCLSFVAGAKYQHLYHYFVVVLVVVGAVSQMRVIVAFIDLAFALMAFPTMISALLLSGKVRRAAVDYFRRYKAGEF